MGLYAEIEGALIFSMKLITLLVSVLFSFEAYSLSLGPEIVGGVEVSPTIEVIKQIKPSDYSETSPADRNDIALLLLEKSIPAGYEMAQLIRPSESLQADDSILVAGYGINQTSPPADGDGGAGILRFAEQRILDTNFGKKEVLISLKDRGTCHGDSGGPAFFKKNNELFLFGTASRMTDKDIVPGSKPARYECTEEVVYANVRAQAEWLQAAELELRKK